MKLYLIVLLNLFFFLPVFGQHESSRDADSLIKAISEAKTDTGRILSKCRLSEAYRSSKPDTSFILANEALAVSRKINFGIGEIHSHVVLSVLLREKGDLPAALNEGLRALKLSEEEQYHYGEIASLVRVANVYLAVRGSRKAIAYLNRSEELLKKSPNDFMRAATHFFLADAYDQLNKLDSALLQIEMVDQQIGADTLWGVFINRTRGNIAVKRNELHKAAEYYRRSISSSIAVRSYRDAAYACNSLATVLKKLNQPDSAIFYAKEGLKYGEMLSYKNRVLAASSLLAELYEKLDPAEAVKYYKIASAAKDSLYGVEKVQQLQNATIREQERQTEMEAARLAYRNKVRQYAFLAGAAVFLIVALILYRNNGQKQKTNKVLETTLSHLKATQSQLIQSEKMASLGELTAGIAHEIQNPLNFVNNFSEVNKELIEELKSVLENSNGERLKVKTERNENVEVDLINTIGANEEKINHHGKRADAIVKGMLQHSRISTGQRELTDVNSLADEYLRLAFHGMRAKDNTFNAEIQTDFDPHIGKINIIPQEIGRVLLNLYNNAFYAVDEKRKQNLNGYEPTVLVSTRKNNGKIELKVTDNGNGISAKVIDKIFQPFFTTKPTGQGTGLGLSLAYDIVKAHGGEIKVNTKDGEGAEFIVQLPVV